MFIWCLKWWQYELFTSKFHDCVTLGIYSLHEISLFCWFVCIFYYHGSRYIDARHDTIFLTYTLVFLKRALSRAKARVDKLLIAIFLFRDFVSDANNKSSKVFPWNRVDRREIAMTNILCLKMHIKCWYPLLKWWWQILQICLFHVQTPPSHNYVWIFTSNPSIILYTLQLVT